MCHHSERGGCVSHCPSPARRATWAGFALCGTLITRRRPPRDHARLELFEGAATAEVPFADFYRRWETESGIVGPSPQRHRGDAELSADLRIRYETVRRTRIVITGIIAITGTVLHAAR